jgi:hypothetical protein
MAVTTFSRPSPAWLRRAWLIVLVLLLPLTGAALCWWLTAPLDDDAPEPYAASAAAATTTTATTTGADAAGLPADTPAMPDWPETRLEGDAAKRLLLDTLLAVQQRLAGVAGYTAILRKQERIGGVLGPEQTLAIKIRHHPFAVYIKYLSPHAGKEVVYAAGHHEDKVIAHSAGLARLLVPRLAVAPDSPLALADSRHAITEAGLAKLTEKLIGFRRMDLEDPEAGTILDRTTDADGRTRLRSVHTHPHFNTHRPFARVEVRYDPETRLPRWIESFDWPAPDAQGEPLLAERYVYEDVDLNAVLGPLDFDPANPDYAFHRY